MQAVKRCPNTLAVPQPARPKKDLTSRRAGSVQTHIEVHSPPAVSGFKLLTLYQKNVETTFTRVFIMCLYAQVCVHGCAHVLYTYMCDHWVCVCLCVSTLVCLWVSTCVVVRRVGVCPYASLHVREHVCALQRTADNPKGRRKCPDLFNVSYTYITEYISRVHQLQQQLFSVLPVGIKPLECFTTGFQMSEPKKMRAIWRHPAIH